MSLLPKHPSEHSRPFDNSFYATVRESAARQDVHESVVLSAPEGVGLDVQEGVSVRFELVGESRPVHIFPMNANDPKETYWAHETALIEGLHLTRWSRLWGTMPRFRPLATFLDDTVATSPNQGILGKHHCSIGAWGAASHLLATGRCETPPVWTHMSALMSGHATEMHVKRDELVLFQKTRIEPYMQRYEILPSDALAGDSVTLFAEIDLRILVAPSPYPDERERTRSQPIEPFAISVQVSEKLAQPLPWPYSNVPYPDLSKYVEE